LDFWIYLEILRSLLEIYQRNLNFTSAASPPLAPLMSKIRPPLGTLGTNTAVIHRAPVNGKNKLASKKAGPGESSHRQAPPNNQNEGLVIQLRVEPVAASTSYPEVSPARSVRLADLQLHADQAAVTHILTAIRIDRVPAWVL
jgi:hypothetical protein